MKDNKLIAEFMELEVDNGLYCYTTAMDDYKTDTLYFHSSWDWLMPVVKKCMITGDNTDYWDDIFDALSLLSINAVYGEVVEFIKRTKKSTKSNMVHG